MKITIQYLYIFFIPKNWRYVYRAKIGITDNVQRRLGEVSASIKEKTGRSCRVYRFVAVPMLSTRKWEKLIHKITKRISAKMTGSGKTEWRWYLNPILALCAGWFGPNLSGANWDVLRFLAVLLIPLPLDFAVLVITVFLVELCMVLLFLYAALQILNILLQTI